MTSQTAQAVQDYIDAALPLFVSSMSNNGLDEMAHHAKYSGRRYIFSFGRIGLMLCKKALCVLHVR